MPKLPARPEEFRDVLSFLPADWRDVVREFGLVTSFHDSKIEDPDDLMQLLFAHVGCHLPLRQTVEWVRAAGGPSCSHVTLHRKMRKAGPAMAALVQRMSVDAVGTDAEAWCGYEIVALDGSVVVTPGPTSFGGRLHVALRLSDLSVVDALVTTTEDGETLRRFDWRPGQLVLCDRGYSSPPGIQHLTQRGADVLVRVNRGALPLYCDATGARLDVLAWVRTLKGQGAHETSVRVTTDDGAPEVRGRLVVQRIPKDKIAAARKRAREDSRGDAAAVEMAEWVVVFTTVPSTRMTTAQVAATYQLRWQVELLFKRWKSLGRLDELPNYRRDSLVTWLTAKLLLLLVAERMANAATAAFPPRAIGSAQDSHPSAHGAPALESSHHVVAGDRRSAAANAAA